MMRSSADDPFFSFFQQSRNKTKTFLMKKEKRTGRSFLCLHTDVFFGKEPLQEYKIYKIHGSLGRTSIFV